MVVLFISGISIIFGYYLITTLSTNFVGSGIFTTEETDLMTPATNAIHSFDYLMAFMMVGFGVSCVISAVFVKTHPVFFVAMMIGQLIILGISSIFSNVFYSIMSTPELVASANQFPVISTIFTHLPLVILAFSCLVAIVSYGRPVNTNALYQ